MTEYAIVPQPVSVKYTAGNFKSNSIGPIVCDGGLFENEVRVFKEQIVQNLGEEAFCKSASAQGSPAIRLAKTEGYQAEAYRLEILPQEIRLCATDAAGIFRGLQVLRQLFLSQYSDGGISTPCGIIEDKPGFPWRGLMLDCARNFFSVKFIKKLLDSLCLQHISVFHWHLSDDQGWRLPVKEYPLLTQISCKRYDNREHDYSSGFYTEDEIREIVRFAAERHIEVVPEIDLPGHTSAVLAAYPGFGCTGGPYKVEDRFGVFEDVLCAGNDGIFDLAEAVFDTLAGLFPSRYVHIGGDEVRFNRWSECPKCKKRIADLGLETAGQLQSWITCRLVELLQKHGKTAIGWDEILDNTEKFPLPENAMVMYWRGWLADDNGSKATALGRRVIMSPTSSGCYFDHKHTDDPEELGRKWVSTVAQAYGLKPVTPQMGDGAAALVLGGQGNLWSETVYSGRLAEYLIFPRICAIAEALWTASENRDIGDFENRLSVHSRRLDRLGLLHYQGPLG
jgi:hexosaminidase